LPELIGGSDIPIFLLDEGGNMVVDLEVTGTWQVPRFKLKTGRVTKKTKEKLKERFEEGLERLLKDVY